MGDWKENYKNWRNWIFSIIYVGISFILADTIIKIIDFIQKVGDWLIQGIEYILIGPKYLYDSLPQSLGQINWIVVFLIVVALSPAILKLINLLCKWTINWEPFKWLK